jgi:hypothetical protein
MACYHFTIKPDKRPDNSQISATEHVDYINRNGKFKDIDEKEQTLEQISAISHAEYINRESEFKSKGGCIYQDHHLPAWAEDSPKNFFAAAEAFEGTGYSRYKEIEFALPTELTLEQNKEIIDTFLENHLKDFYYAYAVHDKDASMGNGERNTHVHIMFSERKIDASEKEHERTPKQFFARPFVLSKKNPEMTEENRGGCSKDEKWNGRGRARYLCEMRHHFAIIQNTVLEKYDHSVRIDHRSLEAQREDALQRGDIKLAELLDRLPEKHLGPEVAAQKNHKKVIALKKYRAYKWEHRQLLYAADMLEASIEKDEIADQIDKNVKKTTTLSKTDDFKTANTHSLHSLKTEVLSTLKEIFTLKNIVIRNDQAINIAREKFMTKNERDVYNQLKKAQEERLSIKRLQNSLPKPSTWDHESKEVYTELKAELTRREQELDQKCKEVGKTMQPISKLLGTPIMQKQIQTEVRHILHDDTFTKDMLKKATTKLDILVPKLQNEITRNLQEQTKQLSDPATPKARFTAKEVATTLRASIKNLDAEINDRAKILGKLSSRMISLPRAKEMAKDVFAQGAYKNLREKRQLLKKELPRIETAKKEYLLAEQEFLEMEKPRWYQKKDTYNAEAKRIAEMKNVVTLRENKFNSQLKNIDMEFVLLETKCTSPAVQRKVAQIALGILTKNKPITQKYNDLSKKQTLALSNRKELKNLQSTVQHQIQLDRGKHISYQASGGNMSNENQASVIAKALSGDEKMAQLVARFEDEEEIYDGMTALDKKLVQRDHELNM